MSAALAEDLKLGDKGLHGIFQPEAHLPRWGSVLEDAESASTILLVDQLDLNRRLLRGILKATPFRLLEASHPNEALEILARDKIDLVIVDQSLPGMSVLPASELE